MSVHFTRAELIRSQTAQDRKINNITPEYLLPRLDSTMAGLERIRDVLGFPMKIHSGYRCPDLNAAIGGAKNSQHMLCEAADFTCPGFGDPTMIVNKLKPLVRTLGIDQLILESTWVHVSFTTSPRYHVLKAMPGGKFEQIS